jgi:hypothetical protein
MDLDILEFSFLKKVAVEKSRQRRSRHFSVLTYSPYAPRIKMAAALLSELFLTAPRLWWPRSYWGNMVFDIFIVQDSLKWNYFLPGLLVMAFPNEKHPSK